MVVDATLATCTCGNLAVKNISFSQEGVALFVDDISTITLYRGYKDSSGNVTKLIGLPDIVFGKSYFLNTRSVNER